MDGDEGIFLDGQKIGEQKEPPEVMWDQAFTVALPVAFAAGTPHKLVVRVKKDSQAAGIWRPVRVPWRGSKGELPTISTPCYRTGKGLGGMERRTSHSHR